MDDKSIQRLDWEKFYKETPASLIPWESGKPDEQLVKLVKSGVIRKGAKVLDLGCGLGTQTVYLAENGFDATGIDISETAVSKAKKLAEDKGVKARFVVGDAVKMPFEDDTFDFVYDRGCLHHLEPEKRELYVSELKRVFSPGGFFSLLVFADIIPPKEGEKLFLSDFKIIQTNPVLLRFPDGGSRLLIDALLRKLTPEYSKIIN